MSSKSGSVRAITQGVDDGWTMQAPAAQGHVTTGALGEPPRVAAVRAAPIGDARRMTPLPSIFRDTAVTRARGTAPPPIVPVAPPLLTAAPHPSNVAPITASPPSTGSSKPRALTPLPSIFRDAAVARARGTSPPPIVPVTRPQTISVPAVIAPLPSRPAIATTAPAPSVGARRARAAAPPPPTRVTSSPAPVMAAPPVIAAPAPSPGDRSVQESQTEWSASDEAFFGAGDALEREGREERGDDFSDLDVGAPGTARRSLLSRLFGWR